ncbi:hypothetical protein F2Q70_00025797 [Brassica cretica]|uniref:Uncharacterized protein n=1 Tax=Brassica cretica TaxID=69181 RepID=A0A8S9LIQ5_BRACR|nr:hypothetical protein F2Q70_00025797 [Brassica cretica]
MIYTGPYPYGSILRAGSPGLSIIEAGEYTQRHVSFLLSFRRSEHGSLVHKNTLTPRAHRGHYNFNEPPGSKQRSPDSNLRVPTWRQRPKYNFRKKDRTPVQPRAHRGHYVPKEPPDSQTTSRSKYPRVPIRSPDQKEKICTLVRPQGSVTIIETSGFQPAISGSVRESSGSYIAFGPQSRSHDLEKRPQGLE